MPSGLLKEKLCGLSSGKLLPQQERASLNRRLKLAWGPVVSAESARTSPWPSRRASSTLSVIRRLSLARAMTRSMTTAMLCLSFLSSFGRGLERVDLAVDLDADEAAAAQLLEEVLVLALAVGDDGGEQDQAGVLGVVEELLDDLLRGGGADRLAALGAVLDADAGVEDTQVVVDLGDGADGGARVVGGALLLDGDGGREAAQVLDLGALELAEELARVGGEALDVAALALGVEGVEGEAGLARAADAGEDDELALGHAAARRCGGCARGRRGSR
jgi:hypothetical protein